MLISYLILVLHLKLLVRPWIRLLDMVLLLLLFVMTLIGLNSIFLLPLTELQRGFIFNLSKFKLVSWSFAHSIWSYLSSLISDLDRGVLLGRMDPLWAILELLWSWLFARSVIWRLMICIFYLFYVKWGLAAFWINCFSLNTLLIGLMFEILFCGAVVNFIYLL